MPPVRLETGIVFAVAFGLPLNDLTRIGRVALKLAALSPGDSELRADFLRRFSRTPRDAPRRLLPIAAGKSYDPFVKSCDVSYHSLMELTPHAR